MLHLSLCLLLSGCATVQVFPAVSTETYDLNGVLLYVEPNPTSRYSVSVTHSDQAGYRLNLGAKFRF
jgi:hypothetical protein